MNSVREDLPAGIHDFGYLLDGIHEDDRLDRMPACKMFSKDILERVFISQEIQTAVQFFCQFVVSFAFGKIVQGSYILKSWKDLFLDGFRKLYTLYVISVKELFCNVPVSIQETDRCGGKPEKLSMIIFH